MCPCITISLLRRKKLLDANKTPSKRRPRLEIFDSSVDGDTKTVPCNHKLYEAFISSYKPKNDYTTDIIQFHGIGGIVYTLSKFADRDIVDFPLYSRSMIPCAENAAASGEYEIASYKKIFKI